MSLYLYQEISSCTLMDALRRHFKAHGLDISEEEVPDFPCVRYRDVVYQRTKSGKFRKDEEGRPIVDREKTEWRTVYLDDDCEIHFSLALEEKDASGGDQ